jgi:hypothetical protein
MNIYLILYFLVVDIALGVVWWFIVQKSLSPRDPTRWIVWVMFGIVTVYLLLQLPPLLGGPEVVTPLVR